MTSVRQLEATLAECEQRLADLGPIHHADSYAKHRVKVIALQARIDYLRRELSTARVEEAVRAVHNARRLGSNTPTTTRASSAPEPAPAQAGAR